MFNPRTFILALSLFAIWSGSIWMHGRGSATSAAQIKQAKQTEKVRKIHAKVKRQAPGNSDKPTAIEWLRQHTK